MPKVIIDGEEWDIEDGLSLLQACEVAGLEVPRFCYHERLSIAGNCRMCLVEVKGMPKPQASCALRVNDLRPGPNGELPEIITTSETVHRARRGVMEFLLANHPLDCPICDQGGECDLQDQALFYGSDGSRFCENKRAVEDKDMGPLIKTHMTRCIHCTRCVRFLSEVVGTEELGAIGRGEDMEITAYLDRHLSGELQGNLVDLCPVGALTSRPYAFKGRPWELSKYETVDVMDALGSAIRVDVRGLEVMRILPRVHEDINEEWISDKTRFVWDGLRRQRLDRPYIRSNGVLKQASWEEALGCVSDKIAAASPERVAALAGDLVGVEEVFVLKTLLERLGGCHFDCRDSHSPLGEMGGRAGYLFNATIAGIDQADAILLVGTNPRLEAAVLDVRIGRAVRERGVRVGSIGASIDVRYAHEHLGEGASAFSIFERGDTGFAEAFLKARFPLVIVGQGALSRPDGGRIWSLALSCARKACGVREDWNGFSILHTAAGRVGALDVGFFPREDGKWATADILDRAEGGGLDVLFLLGGDEQIQGRALGKTFVVYQGSHGDRGAERADVVLPGASYIEKSATYVNTEGRVQRTQRALFPPGEAREDWTIVVDLAERLGVALPFGSLAEVRKALYAAHPHLSLVGELQGGGVAALEGISTDFSAPASGEALSSPIVNYYLTNPIARSSEVMAKCASLQTKLSRGTALGGGREKKEAMMGSGSVMGGGM